MEVQTEFESSNREAPMAFEETSNQESGAHLTQTNRDEFGGTTANLSSESDQFLGGDKSNERTEFANDQYSKGIDPANDSEIGEHDAEEAGNCRTSRRITHSRNSTNRLSMKTIERPCLVCGTVLEITVDDDGQYSGGYYFGEFGNPVGDGDHKKVDEIDLNGQNTDIVEWTGETETVEYWECRECYRGPEPPKTR